MVPPNEGSHKDPDESIVGRECMVELIGVGRVKVLVAKRSLRAYPNNPAQRKAIKAQAKWRKAR